MTNPTKTEPTQALTTTRKPKALEVLAGRLNVDPQKLYATLKNTVFKGATDEEMLALVVVANRYNLDPLTRQLYAFPDRKRGGIVPMVPIDGWAAICNSQPEFDGCEFEFTWADEKKRLPDSCTCSIYLKNRSHPMKVTEYYTECFRDSDPWKQMPARMLRHKALMQCARYAFSIGGVYDEDEARDIINVEASVVPAPTFLGPPQDALEASEDAPGGEPAEKPAPRPKTPPAKPEPAKKATPEPAPEPETVEVGNQGESKAELAQPDAPEEAPAGMSWAQCYDSLMKIMKKDQIDETQLIVYCRKEGMAKGNQGIRELGQSKLQKLIENWNDILAELSA